MGQKLGSAEEDLWRRTLQQIPTQLGKLAYLSRLRNPETDRYEHYGLSAVFGAEAADAAMRASHQDLLEVWLGYTLEILRNDLEAYLTSLPQSFKKGAQSWLRTQPYLAFLPPQASAAQRELFSANMLLLLRSFTGEATEDHRGQRASPRP